MHARIVGGHDDETGADTQVCATLYSPKTGIFMEMFTNEPGVQVYTGNFQGIQGEENVVRKLGKHYPQYISVCLESQKYPDSPNHPEWPSPVLNPGEKYYSHAAYKFSVK
jgi:aldose 1-epimerase